MSQSLQSTQTTAQVRTAKRMEWVDYAKGMAAISVVFVHVLHGVIRAGLITNEQVKFLADSWSEYSLNMPVFFFLAGLFAVSSVKKPLGDFMSDKLRTLVYPYVLWSFIAMFVGTLAVKYTNFGMTLNDWPNVLYSPVLIYWFLYAMFILMTVFAVMNKLNIDIRWFVALMVGLFLFGKTVDVYGFSEWMGRLFEFGIFFAFGAYFNERIKTMFDGRSTRNIALIGVTALIIFAFFVAQGPNFVPPLMEALVSATGLVMAICISEVLARKDALTILRSWGRISLQIYLVHVLAGVGFRVLLARFLHIDNGALHLFGGWLVGINSAVFLVWFGNKIGFTYLFTFPKQIAKTQKVKAVGEKSAA